MEPEAECRCGGERWNRRANVVAAGAGCHSGGFLLRIMPPSWQPVPACVRHGHSAGEPFFRAAAMVLQAEPFFFATTTIVLQAEPFFFAATTIVLQAEPIFFAATTIVLQAEPFFFGATTIELQAEPFFFAATTIVLQAGRSYTQRR